MSAENRVVVHGLWCSPYVKRVELALKIKAIPFQYVEQDLINKSELLLKYNPVYKKVPVLVHNGKPIVESLIILEYIDETWKNEPRLFPEDPFQRAQLRFWASYIQQLLETCQKVFFPSEGKEAEDKARKDMFGKLDILEEGLKKLVWRNNDDGLDVVDIMMVATLGPFKAQEEFLGIKILDPNNHPFIFQSVKFLVELSVVKEITPPHHELVSLLHNLRQFAIKVNLEV